MKIIYLIILLLFTSLFSENIKFVYSDFPPFEYVEDGKNIGINIEIIEEICRRLGITPEFEKLPWKRALQSAKDGNADAVFSLFVNEERKQFYDFPAENLNSVKMVLITNKDNDIIISNLSDLKGKRVGVYLGSSYGEEFDNADWFVKDAASSNDILLKKQDAKRTDLIVIDERVADYWSEKLDFDNNFKTLDFVVNENKTYIAFSRKKELNGLSEKFSKILSELKKEGFIKHLNRKYMLNEYE